MWDPWSLGTSLRKRTSHRSCSNVHFLSFKPWYPTPTTTATPLPGPTGAPVILVVARIVIRATLNFSTIIDGGSNYARLVVSLRADLARLLGLPARFVVIRSLRVGSLIVDYAVEVPREEAAANYTVGQLEQLQQQVVSRSAQVNPQALANFTDAVSNITQLPPQNFTVESVIESIPSVASQLSGNSPQGLSGGAIAGIVIGSVCFALVVMVLGGFVWWKRRESNAVPDEPNVPTCAEMLPMQSISTLDDVKAPTMP